MAESTAAWGWSFNSFKANTPDGKRPDVCVQMRYCPTPLSVRSSSTSHHGRLTPPERPNSIVLEEVHVPCAGNFSEQFSHAFYFVLRSIIHVHRRPKKEQARMQRDVNTSNARRALQDDRNPSWRGHLSKDSPHPPFRCRHHPTENMVWYIVY